MHLFTVHLMFSSHLSSGEAATSILQLSAPLMLLAHVKTSGQEEQLSCNYTILFPPLLYHRHLKCRNVISTELETFKVP